METFKVSDWGEYYTVKDETDNLRLLINKYELEQMFKKYLAPLNEKIESSVMGIRSDLNKIAEQTKAITKQYDQLYKNVSVVESNLAKNRK